MAISILHRVAGVGLATVGAAVLVWWLVSAASGPDAYAQFVTCMTTPVFGFLPVGYIILIGLTWAFFEHLFSGLRHFVLDMGAGYELQTNKTWSIACMVGAPVVTAIIWACIFSGAL